jgi:hypothetical protein
MMTLGNMRANGVHTLAVYCGGRWCNHDALLDVGGYPDDVPVPSFGPRIVCTICGAIGADERSNWHERVPEWNACAVATGARVRSRVQHRKPCVLLS